RRDRRPADRLSAQPSQGGRPVSSTAAPLRDTPAETRVRPARPGRRTGRRAAGRAGQYLALLCYVVFLAFPLLWLLSTAFKPPQELASVDPSWLPHHPTLDNFRTAVDEQPLLRSAVNSLLVSVVTAVISVAIAVPAAYVMVRFRSLVSRLGTGWVLVSQMF